MNELTPTTALDRIYKTFIVLALSIIGLIALQDIVIPIAFASIFSVVLLPIVKRLENKIGRVVSISLVLLASVTVISLVMWLVIDQLAGLASSLPNLESKFTGLITQLNTTISRTFNIGLDEQSQLLKEALKNLSSNFGALFLSTSYLAYFFIQVPIYIFLLLLYREKFKDFFLSFTSGEELKWQKQVTGVIRGYISGLIIVVLIAGTLNSIGLLLLGIENAIFFGFLSGALTMIPYIGIIIGASFPTLFALLTKDSLWYPIGVIGIHLVVQFLEGNLITPKITGSKISINALAAVIALLIGGKILGIAGMILAIPAAGVLRILLSYSNSWKPFVILLEDKPVTKEELHEVLGDKEDEPLP